MRIRYKLTVILLSIFILNLMFPMKGYCDKIRNNILTVDNFILSKEEWQRIGADYQIDSNDGDTSYVWFNWSTNLVKTLSYFTFENITIPTERTFNVTSILNVTVYYTIRCDAVGQAFSFDGWWHNGSDWYQDGGYATEVAEYHTPAPHNLTGFLDTPEKVENVFLKLTNHGAPIWDNEGRITYIYLDVWFTYVGIYVYPLRLIFGLLGLAIMILSPTLAVREVLKKKNWEMIGGCMALFCIGYACVLVWLIP